MKRLAAAILLLASAASAHRLDEYLEATLISVDGGTMHADLRLTPGVAVLPAVLREIDTNGDGAISDAEQRAYAAAVLRDLSFAIDGARLTPRLLSYRFPSIDAMRDGLGEIHMEMAADLPRGDSHRRLTFENHHQFLIGAYLVNALAPRDPDIRIEAQQRNYAQSSYELDFTDTSRRARPLLSSTAGPAGTAAFLLLAAMTFLLRRWFSRLKPASH